MKGNQFTDELSKEIYEQTYRYGDETLELTQKRVAEDIASIESDREKWSNEFLKILENFQFVPGGRIISNAGTQIRGTTYINCFVDGFTGQNQDSIGGIMEALKRQAYILKSEGGYGFCADVIRPRGGYIEGIANETPGAVKWLDNWNTQSDVITAGSGKKTENKKGKQKIRKGAQMVTMSCWHPDVEEFITAKQTPGKLDKFNMSTLITDAFMEAVLNNNEWNLIFPDFDKDKNYYDEHWDGNINKWIENGQSVKVYKTFKDANELWDLIMKSTYNRNEPGVLFVDTMNRLNNLAYCEYINATNPCGEQILPIGGVCLLGNLNLTQFIKDDMSGWDYERLKQVIPIAVRFMDNVNDLTYVPLEDQKFNLLNKRRIGLGVMGYGSALLMMKVRYGSIEALKITEDLMNFIANTAYQSSALLSKEKGAFLMFDSEKYLQSKFIYNLSDETKRMIREFGIRNSHLLSIQPTGNSSILANIASGGLEPVFLFDYIRTVIQPFAPDGLSTPINIDWAGMTYTQTGVQDWKWVKEGDENMLKTEFQGNIYKFDRGRGLLKESIVKDYGVRYLEEKGEWDPNANWAANINNLKIDEHIETMKVISKYIDSSMSKCVSEGTLITTNKGIIPIESLSDNETPDSFSDINGNYKILDENGDFKKITKHYFGGDKDCYNIRFDNGFNVDVAYTHKFKTENGWKSVLDLNEQDIIFYRNNKIENNNEYIKLEKSPDFYNSIKYNYPKIMDENYAKFIGMLLSDGYINKNSVGIVEKNEKVGDEIDKLFEILFKVKSKVAIDKRSGVKSHMINSRPMVKFYKEFIGSNALNKDIPNEILLSNDKVKMAFLEGLSLDGYIKTDKNLVIYGGYSYNIANKVSYILSSLGYEYHLQEKNVKNGRLSKKMFIIKGYLTDSNIIPIEEHKLEYSITGKKHRKIFVENKKTYEDLPNTQNKDYFLFRNLRKSLKSSSFTRKDLLDKLGISYDNNLTCVKITDIKHIGKRKVYDIEVEDTHSYLINGIVSHNTINLPNDYKYEDFKHVYIELFKSGTIKGGTTYRAGTMATVIKKKDDVEDSLMPPQENNVPKRPKALECDVQRFTNKGEKWIGFIGLNKGMPYEIFTGLAESFIIPGWVEKGVIRKEKVKNNENEIISRYDFVYLDKEGYEIIMTGLNRAFEREYWNIGKMTSALLRHHIHLPSVIRIIESLKLDGDVMGTWKKGMIRMLKKYIKGETGEVCKKCGSHNLVYKESCVNCLDCGWSGC